MSYKLFICFALLALYSSFTSGRSVRGKHHRKGHGRNDLRHLTCNVFNETSSEVIKQRTCGCDEEEEVDCSLGPLTITGKHGETLAVTFCDTPQVLKSACLITDSDGEILRNKTCTRKDETAECSLGPLDTTVNTTEVQAFFCDFEPKEHSKRSDKDNSHSSSSSSSSSEGDESSDDDDGAEGDEGEDDVPQEPLVADDEDDDDKCIKLGHLGKGKGRGNGQPKEGRPQRGNNRRSGDGPQPGNGGDRSGEQRNGGDRAGERRNGGNRAGEQRNGGRPSGRRGRGGK